MNAKTMDRNSFFSNFPSSYLFFFVSFFLLNFRRSIRTLSLPLKTYRSKRKSFSPQTNCFPKNNGKTKAFFYTFFIAPKKKPNTKDQICNGIPSVIFSLLRNYIIRNYIIIISDFPLKLKRHIFWNDQSNFNREKKVVKTGQPLKYRDCPIKTVTNAILLPFKFHPFLRLIRPTNRKDNSLGIK